MKFRQAAMEPHPQHRPFVPSKCCMSRGGAAVPFPRHGQLLCRLPMQRRLLCQALRRPAGMRTQGSFDAFAAHKGFRDRMTQCAACTPPPVADQCSLALFHRSLSSDLSLPGHQALDAPIAATGHDSSRASQHPVAAHTMLEAGLVDDMTLGASNATPSPTHFPHAPRASISNAPHTLPKSTAASGPDLANAAESVLEFFQKFADKQAQQFDR